MQSGVSITKSTVNFDQLSIERLAKKYNTPLFVFSEQRLIDNYKTFERSFKSHYPNTFIHYSIKTNFELEILKRLKSLGSMGEAASALEVLFAQKAGFSPSDLILDGPAWTDEDIEYCIKKDIRTLNVDSPDELERVNKIAKKNKKKVRISFRIFPEIKMSILKSFIEGYIAKFGVPLSKAILAYKKAQEMSNILPVSISTHIGSMITNPAFYEQAISRLVKLTANLKSELNINIDEINLGGGFGIQSLNYYSLQNAILEKAGISKYAKASSIEEFGKRITGAFKNKLKQYNLPKLKLILEPGRFLVSDCGILVTKVVAVKDQWIFIDGGINLIPESIFFIRRGFIVVNKAKSKQTNKYNIAGPTLNTADVLAVNQKMPKMEVGDIIVVLDAGAYSLSRSNQFTILRPDVIFINNKKQIKFLRRKETPEDILSKLL